MRKHADQLVASTIKVTELHYGVGRSSDPGRNRRAVAEFLAFVEVLSFDGGGRARRRHPCGAGRARDADGGYAVVIAGHPRSQGMTVVTHNRREFDECQAAPGRLVSRR